MPPRKRATLAGLSKPAAATAAPSSPTKTKKEKIRDCLKGRLDAGPDAKPKDKWPQPVGWDPEANEIAKCLKRKFPKANQSELKQLLVDNHGTARKIIIERLATKIA